MDKATKRILRDSLQVAERYTSSGKTSPTCAAVAEEKACSTSSLAALSVCFSFTIVFQLMCWSIVAVA